MASTSIRQRSGKIENIADSALVTKMHLVDQAAVHGNDRRLTAIEGISLVKVKFQQCLLEAKNIGGASSLGEQQYSYQNLYVTGLIKQGGILVTNIEDAIAYIKTKAGEFDE